MVECLPSRHKVLSSNPSTIKKEIDERNFVLFGRKNEHGTR
jgi:hypothetical protein